MDEKRYAALDGTLFETIDEAIGHNLFTIPYCRLCGGPPLFQGASICCEACGFKVVPINKTKDRADPVEIWTRLMKVECDNTESFVYTFRSDEV